jgi:hypothetical protein
MEIAPLVIFGLVALLILGLGMAVKYLKAYWLISGYNTMSQEKKKNVDVEGLGSFVGNFCFVLGAIIFLGGLFIAFGKSLIGLIIFAFIFPASIYAIIKSQKYDGNSKNPDGTMNTKTKIIIGSISLLIIFTFIGTGILMYRGSKPTEFTVVNGYLDIQGFYGEKINFEDIKEISLKDAIPKVNYKSNGFALGSKKKGYFKLDEVGSSKLFIDDSKPPFIFVKTSSKLYILNYPIEEQTKELYNILMAEWK